MKYIKEFFHEFSADNIFKYSASLAYYTVFSLAPLLIILVTLSGVFFGKNAIQGQLYAQLNDLLGSNTALQIQEAVKSIHLSGHSFVATVISSGILIVSSTTVFADIQDSLNKMWGLRTRKKKVWWSLLITRLLAFALILSIVLLLMASVVLNTLVNKFGVFLSQYNTNIDLYLIGIINQVLSFVIAAVLFSLLFKILPDARVGWKEVLIGGLVTAFLFSLGKWGISFYLGKTYMASLYGAASSIIILLLWVYYSAVILYLGAEFARVYAKLYGNPILPNDYSEFVQIKTMKETSPD